VTAVAVRAGLDLIVDGPQRHQLGAVEGGDRSRGV
jgi:hypothetical protein